MEPNCINDLYGYHISPFHTDFVLPPINSIGYLPLEFTQSLIPFLWNQRRRRQKRNEYTGREYQCEYCGRIYMSQSALYTHSKAKHSEYLHFSYNRKRGRPKKEVVINEYPKFKFKTFLPIENKTSCVDIFFEFEDVFNAMYNADSKYKTFKEHPFYKEMIKFHDKYIKPRSLLQMKVDQFLEEERYPHKTCDVIIVEYLYSILNMTTQDCYIQG